MVMHLRTNGVFCTFLVAGLGSSPGLSWSRVKPMLGTFYKHCTSGPSTTNSANLLQFHLVQKIFWTGAILRTTGGSTIHTYLHSYYRSKPKLTR